MKVSLTPTQMDLIVDGLVTLRTFVIDQTKYVSTSPAEKERINAEIKSLSVLISKMKHHVDACKQPA